MSLSNYLEREIKNRICGPQPCNTCGNITCMWRNDMFVKIKEDVREYHIAFEQDRSKKFGDGRPQTVTTCNIFLLTAGRGVTLVGRGVTTLGCKDKDDGVEGCKYALTRALENAKLGKAANALFWVEFQTRHKRLDTIRVGKVTCREAFSNFGGSYGGFPEKLIDVGKAFRKELCQHKVKAKGSGHDWCTKHKFPCRELHPGGHGSGSKTAVPGYGGLHSHQRRAIKKMTTPTGRGPAMFWETKRIKDMMDDHKKKQQWMCGTWHAPDKRLTTQMNSLAAEEFARVDTELLKRAGVTRVHDEYIINYDEFVPAFKAGDIVMWDEVITAKVVSVEGVVLTIQPILIVNWFGKVFSYGNAETVFDWEVEKVTPHWLRRAWKWLRATKAWPCPGDDSLRELSKDDPVVGHGDGVCGRGDFLGT